MQITNCDRKFIRTDRLSERMDALQAQLPPRSEASGQMAYLIYILDDIKKEGHNRSDESKGMLLDIDTFCDEIEQVLKSERENSH